MTANTQHYKFREAYPNRVANRLRAAWESDIASNAELVRDLLARGLDQVYGSVQSRAVFEPRPRPEPKQHPGRHCRMCASGVHAGDGWALCVPRVPH